MKNKHHENHFISYFKKILMEFKDKSLNIEIIIKNKIIKEFIFQCKNLILAIDYYDL